MPYRIIRIKTAIPLKHSNRQKSKILLDFALLEVDQSMANLTKQQYNRIRSYASRYKVKVVGRLQQDGCYTVWRVA